MAESCTMGNRWPSVHFAFSIESILSLIPSAETVSPEIIYSQEPTIHNGIPALNRTFASNPAISANLLQIWIPIAAAV